MTWTVTSVTVTSVDAKLYDSPFSDYSSHQARNGSKIRMAHANTLFTPTRTAEELIPRSVPMPSKEETMRFQLDAGKMTNMIPGAQVDLPKTSLTSKDVPGVPVSPQQTTPTPVPVSTAPSESYHTPRWKGVRARTGYMSDRKTERYHTPRWRGVRARTGYMSDRKTERFEKKGKTALIIVLIILVVLAIAGVLIWKFWWMPKHQKKEPTTIKEKPRINENDYIAPMVDGAYLFGGKKAVKAKKCSCGKCPDCLKQKAKKCSCGKCPSCLRKKAKKAKKSKGKK